MFRISTNWRTGVWSYLLTTFPVVLLNCHVSGRCTVEQLWADAHISSPATSSISYRETPHHRTHVLLAGSLVIASALDRQHGPQLYLASSTHSSYSLSCRTPRSRDSTEVTTLALDQSQPSSKHLVRLSAFLSTGEFIVFSIDHHCPSRSSKLFSYLPSARFARTAPIIQAVYHGNLLVTLSQSFHLSLYDLSSGAVTHTQTLTSFTSHPPSSLVLTPISPSTYKLILAYAMPVYPEHWSVGATELIISNTTLTVLSTRTTRAFDVPNGWIDEQKLLAVREQWGRKVSRVADTQTDGKWIVLAPGEAPLPSARSLPVNRDNSDAPTSFSYSSTSLQSPSSLQLYRLHFPSSTSASSTPKLIFVRTLHGQIGPVSALCLADGRCVSLGVNGSIWVWDLEVGSGTEVYGGYSSRVLADTPNGLSDILQLVSSPLKGTVVFDERTIISAGVRGVEVRRFDV